MDVEVIHHGNGVPYRNYRAWNKDAWKDNPRNFSRLDEKHNSTDTGNSYQAI